MIDGMSRFTSPPEPIVISVKDSEGRKMEITLNWDSSLEETARILRVVLYFLGFTEEIINEVIPDTEE